MSHAVSEIAARALRPLIEDLPVLALLGMDEAISETRDPIGSAVLALLRDLIATEGPAAAGALADRIEAAIGGDDAARMSLADDLAARRDLRGLVDLVRALQTGEAVRLARAAGIARSIGGALAEIGRILARAV